MIDRPLYGSERACINNIPSVSVFLGRLKSSSLVTCLCPNEPIIVDGTAEVEVEVDECNVFDDVGANKFVGVKSGLHGECELAEVLVDANGTPVDEYKS
jgi:hypothetical protein